ncbi:MAG: nitroreductase family protein [Selenomonadaceae bacterium]|nr:nitroreductase family protein [Selenomonadaceae bacterium]
MTGKSHFSKGVKYHEYSRSLAGKKNHLRLKKELPVSVDAIKQLVTKTTELVPDAFNMRSQRVVLVLGAKQDALWDTIYDAFDGKVAREKIDGFKAGAGTVLYFIDTDVVKSLQDQFPRYAENFPIWAQQANGMLQISIWAGLRELGVGANLQHYNPVIDDAVKKLLDIPNRFQLVAQMPFGGIAKEPEPKEPEDITKRVTIVE